MKNNSWFSSKMHRSDHRWGVILAGGNGTRLQRYIKARYGEYRPKQYCALSGSRSMLRHTIDRVSPIFADDHLITTISAGHVEWAIDELHDRQPKTIVIQPQNKETGPGILLPLLHVHKADPQSIVALFPADQFILHEPVYQSFVQQAFRFVAGHPETIVLLGITPHSLQQGYGWIEHDEEEVDDHIHAIRRFWEKPDVRLMHLLHERKCLWNTMTLVGTTAQFLSLYEELMPHVFHPSQRIIASLGTSFEYDVTEDVFRKLPTVNFSRCILEQTTDHLCVLKMNGVYWNDWGDEARILSDLDFLEQQHHLISSNDIVGHLV